jgi:protein SCO1/2
MCAFALFTAPAIAQPMMPSAGPGAPKPLAPDKVLQTVGVDQNLDAQVSPDLKFRDENGKTVYLRDFFGKKPLLLSLVYYECPGLCTMTLNGIATSLKPLTFTPGKEFDILTISFDPREKPELATAKKNRYLKEYGRPNAAPGWHFLTGDEADIKELCKTVGFRYQYDEATKQYAHAAAIMVLTPQGRISRYFYGLEYSSKDIRLGLVEASEERIGTISDAVTLLCYKYDPASGKYSLAILKVMRLGAVLTILSLGTFMFVMFRRDRRNPKLFDNKSGTGETATQAH